MAVHHGQTGTLPGIVSQTSDRQTNQIARAVELGIGVDRPDGIEIVTADTEGRRYAQVLKEILL